MEIWVNFLHSNREILNREMVIYWTKNPTGINFFFPLYIFYAYLPGALY